ncbi:MAG: molybdate ABC transporter permease subunit [Pseudomonadales bacterium]
MLTEFEWQAISLSLKVACYAVAFSLPVAIATAWLLAKRQFFGKSALDALIHLPLVLPPVVIGYLLLLAFTPRGLFGPLLNSLGINISFSWQGAALASAIVAFPLMVRAIRLSMESVDTKLEQAASTLGASGLRIFFTITLPLVTPGILTGTILAFARSLGEFGATITFVSNIPEVTRTIPLAMYSFIQTPGAEAQAAKLCAIAVAIALLALFSSQLLERKMRRRRGTA